MVKKSFYRDVCKCEFPFYSPVRCSRFLNEGVASWSFSRSPFASLLGYLRFCLQQISAGFWEKQGPTGDENNSLLTSRSLSISLSPGPGFLDWRPIIAKIVESSLQSSRMYSGDLLNVRPLELKFHCMSARTFQSPYSLYFGSILVHLI